MEHGCKGVKEIRYTRKLVLYVLNFLARIAVFLLILFLYVNHKEQLTEFMVSPLYFGISPLMVIWCYFMLVMLLHIFPSKLTSMALLKSREDTFIPVPGYSEFELLKYVQDQNRKAWRVMLYWLCFNAMFAFFYLIGVLEEGDLFMLTVFYFLSDYICILLFCPFQTVVMKNKCCINCRIYDWGHFMMFTPMLFIKSFFSWSLFFTSVVVLIKWELVYAKYPERFWNGSNQVLRCVQCRDRTCHLKAALKLGRKSA